MSLKRVAIVGPDCVACGNCVKYCPFGAMTIYKGLYAKVDESKCKGCCQCAIACPADVIVCEKKEVESA